MLDLWPCAGMLDMIQNHTFVGMADSVLGLLQHGTRLYLANTPAITREMFHQQVIQLIHALCSGDPM